VGARRGRTTAARAGPTPLFGRRQSRAPGRPALPVENSPYGPGRPGARSRFI